MARGCGCGCISWLAFELWLSSAVTWLMRVSAINICYVCIARKTLPQRFANGLENFALDLTLSHAPNSHQHASAVFQERMFCKLIRLAYQININASRSLSVSLSLVLFLLWQWPGNILNKWVISDIKCLVNCTEYSVHIHTTHKNINSHSIYMYFSG